MNKIEGRIEQLKGVRDNLKRSGVVVTRLKEEYEQKEIDGSENRVRMTVLDSYINHALSYVERQLIEEFELQHYVSKLIREQQANAEGK